MKGKKIIYLLLALMLPVAVFLFLRLFGRNEFHVPPLYDSVRPDVPAGCGAVTLPYRVPDSVIQTLAFGEDSLVFLNLSPLSAEGKTQLRRVTTQFSADPVHQYEATGEGGQMETWRKCIFFLTEPFDLVLVDRYGRIRGQYVSDDREEVDRMITEIAIILKKY